VRISSEHGNPARLLLRANTPHDHLVATIKKMPFPLSNREFVNRIVFATDINSDLLITFVPVDDVIDYGMSTRTVRGVSRALVRFTPSGELQCKVTLIQYLDAGGVIPRRVVESKLPLALSVVVELRDQFQRDDEIDKLERDQLARVIKDEQQVYSEDEDSLIQRVQDKLGALKDEDFEMLESPDHLVKMGKIFIDGDRRVVIKASVTIDSAVEECAAWDFLKMSRASLKRRSGESSFVKENDHSGVFYFCRDFHIPGGKLRDGVQRLVFKWMSASILEIHSGRVDHGQFPIRDGVVRTTNAVVYKYERLEPVGRVPQTRVTFLQQADMGGLLPKFVVNQLAPKQLLHVCAMRQLFDKSLEIDGATRAQNVGLIAEHAELYSEEENRILAEGERQFEIFKNLKESDLKMASPLTTAKIAYKDGDTHAWGWATSTVRASSEEVLAYLWDTQRRDARSQFDVEKSVDELVNGHNLLYYSRKKSPIEIVADREFLSRFIWRKEKFGFILAIASADSKKRQRQKVTTSAKLLWRIQHFARGSSRRVVNAFNPGSSRRVLRAFNPGAFQIKRQGDEAIVRFVIHPDAGGSIPNWLLNRGLARSLSRVTEVQEHFQVLRGLEGWDAGEEGGADKGENNAPIKTHRSEHADQNTLPLTSPRRPLLPSFLSTNTSE